MRRGLLLFLLINILVLAFLVRSVSTLLRLLVEDGTEDAIHRAELPVPNSSLIESKPRLIPKIIHQTYVNDSIPARWQQPRQSCLDLHADYEYKMWTDEKSRIFIEAEYPWFLETFDGYPHPIQRADVIRYFVLAHFGGVYIDLDDGCNRRLDPLLSFPAWVRSTQPTGISNDVMGSMPQHPFFLRVLDALQTYNRNWLLPYITVMYSTGPLFLSAIWKDYTHDDSRRRGGSGLEDDRVRLLMPDEYYRTPWSFFSDHVGNSWHAGDAKLIFWMGRHWMFLTLMGFLIAGVVGLSAWWIYSRIFLSGNGRSSLRHMLSRRRTAMTTTAATIKARTRRLSPSWFLSRKSSSSPRYHELVDRHDV